MNRADEPQAQAYETLSALADGEADAQAVASACGAWRDDAALRQRWHRYQLIGDLMRSDELGGRGRDAAFLAALRTRLAAEPVVLAPAAPVRHRAGLPRWTQPAALVAGFMVVAVGGVALLRPPAAAPEAATLVQAPAAVAAQPALAMARGTDGSFALRAEPAALASAAEVEPELAERVGGVLIRDARLDEYLAAHQQFGGGTAFGMPAGFLRGAAPPEVAADPGAR